MSSPQKWSGLKGEAARAQEQEPRVRRQVHAAREQPAPEVPEGCY